jgi:hypothetical protein
MEDGHHGDGEGTPLLGEAEGMLGVCRLASRRGDNMAGELPAPWCGAEETDSGEERCDAVPELKRDGHSEVPLLRALAAAAATISPSSPGVGRSSPQRATHLTSPVLR